MNKICGGINVFSVIIYCAAFYRIRQLRLKIASSAGLGHSAVMKNTAMKNIRQHHLDRLFALSKKPPMRAEEMSARLNDINLQARLVHQLDDMTVDFSRQSVRDDDLDALIAWGGTILPMRDAMMSNKNIAPRPTGHADLRDPLNPAAQENITAMSTMVERILSLGVEDVVAIGIGGSYLGPAMLVDALTPFHQGPDIHFVSNLDPSHLDDTLAMLNPITTAIITISKTFTTKEPLVNMTVARKWFDANGVAPQDRFFGVTANKDAALEMDINADNILIMDGGISGRFSLWSAVGLPIMLALGEAGFVELIAGGEQMDKHFASSPVAENMPILGALIQIWNRSFMGCSGWVMAPYDQRLLGMPEWLQQLVMESNGKSLKFDGSPVDLATAPIVFGEPGSNSQHSFFQMIHQSSEIIPVDFIAPVMPISINPNNNDNDNNDGGGLIARHRDLIAQMLAQADSLALGYMADGANGDRSFTGGRPSTLITWQRSTPFALGRMLAYYEHLTVVCGWLLELNSFDQPGVELGKTIAKGYVNYMNNPSAHGTITANSKTYLDRYKD